MIQSIQPYNFKKIDLGLDRKYAHLKLLSELLKIHKIITPEETRDVLNYEKSFFDTHYKYFYDELNEIINGEKSPSIQSRIDIYERETGIKLHVDNNLGDNEFGYALNVLYNFYDTNKSKGYEMPKNIYITKFIEKGYGGFYERDSETIYLRPTYRESYENFFRSIYHENMHHRDRERLSQGVNYFVNHSSKRERLSVAKVLRAYATYSRSEFCACLAEKIENKELFVVQNSEGNLFLRKYFDENSNIKREDLETVAMLYRKFSCPKFTPTEPPKTYLPYIEVPLD